MIDPKPQFDLQSLNTMAVPSIAEYFIACQSVSDISLALSWANSHQLKINVLGGGSNILCGGLVEGVTIQPSLKGVELVSQNEKIVEVRVAAGESWHDTVKWSLAQGYSGLENLALIPGSVGAAPIQNIGAYGVELSDLFVELEAFELESGEIQVFSLEDCRFGYRDSVFKNSARDRYIILSVTLRLELEGRGSLEYPALKAYLESNHILPTPQNIYTAVCALRQQKLPDPCLVPNSGSFFKNPIISRAEYLSILERYEDAPAYDVGDRKKVPAAWLIDKAGWKGQEYDGVRVHSEQALVLTNPNRLPRERVLAAAAAIQQSIFSQFNVSLEIEPQLL